MPMPNLFYRFTKSNYDDFSFCAHKFVRYLYHDIVIINHAVGQRRHVWDILYPSPIFTVNFTEAVLINWRHVLRRSCTLSLAGLLKLFCSRWWFPNVIGWLAISFAKVWHYVFPLFISTYCLTGDNIRIVTVWCLLYRTLHFCIWDAYLKDLVSVSFPMWLV